MQTWENISIYTPINILAEDAWTTLTDDPFYYFREEAGVEAPEEHIEFVAMPREIEVDIDELHNSLNQVYSQYGGEFRGNKRFITFFREKGTENEDIPSSFATNRGLIYINIADIIEERSGEIDINKALTVIGHEWTHAHGIPGVAVLNNPKYRFDSQEPRFVLHKCQHDWLQTSMIDGSGKYASRYVLGWLKEASIGLITFEAMKNLGYRNESTPDISSSLDFAGLREGYTSVVELFNTFLTNVPKGVSKWLDIDTREYLNMISQNSFRLPENRVDLHKMLIKAHFDRHALNGLVLLLYEIYSKENTGDRRYANKWEALMDDVHFMGIELEPEMLVVD